MRIRAIGNRRTPFGLAGAFVRDETGAVTVDWTVMTAGLVGLGLATMSLVSGGIENLSGDTAAAMADRDIIYESQNFGRDRAAVLRAGDWQHYNGNQMANMFNNWSDPEFRTDAQLRNSHRTWTNRANDPALWANTAQA
jgi:Flp pilus assembly pilin Flp